jgi:glycosyltransferase involved in cell wall biosynthesis
MRVVHVTPYFAPAYVYGGPPRSVLALCQGLQAAGVDVEVVTTVANGPTDLPASPPAGDGVSRFEGVPVHYAPRAVPGVLFNAAIAAPLRRALADADLCHIHGLWTLPAWTAARLAGQMNVPYIISPRGMLQPAALGRRQWRKRLAYLLVERRHLAGAIRVHATSAQEAAALTGFVDRSRIITVPNSVEIDGAARAVAGARARLGIEPGAPLIVFLGRIHPIKRLDLLAEAVTELRRTHPAATLALAGPDEGGLSPLQPLLAGLGPHLRVLGPIGDAVKWDLLKEATALVLCSDSENFGTAVVEAMAAGCPVVATKTCPWAELAESGSGFWVRQDAQAIAAALARLVADPAAAAEMGTRGRASARGRYDKRVIGAAMAACYQDVLAVRRQVA